MLSTNDGSPDFGRKIPRPAFIAANRCVFVGMCMDFFRLTADSYMTASLDINLTNQTDLHPL